MRVNFCNNINMLFCCGECNRGRNFYYKGKEKLENEMNFFSIIKDLRKVKILMNNSLMKPKAR